MNILFSTTSHAAIVQASDAKGDRRATAAIPAILEGQDSPVRSQALAFREAAERFAAEAVNIIATYAAVIQPAKFRAAAAATLAKPFQALMAGGQAESRAKEAAWARLIAVPVADATTAALRQHDRSTFALLAIGDKAAWIERADVDQLAAVIEAGPGRFTDISGEIWQRAERRFAALNFVRLAGTAADYARKPTINEPLATGVDMDAAERAAHEGLARHDKRSEIIDGVTQALQGIVQVVALTCDLSMDAAWQLLNTGQVPV